MGKERVHRWLVSELSQLRHGDLASAELLNGLLSCSGLELHLRAIVGSAKVCWVLDMRHDRYLRTGFLSTLDSQLRLVNAIQTSLNDWLESRRRTLLYSFWHLWWESREGLPSEPSEASIPSYAVVVSAVILLSLVYQYLTGNVDRGGSRAYSRSSLDFRDIYVTIVLFLGTYVWIKFREAACRGVHPRTLVYKQGDIKVVYEARLTPSMCDGKKVPRLDLGQFDTEQEAHNKFLIAAFYYDRDAGFLDGWFQVPSMSEEERSLTGERKRKWVISQAKRVYEDFKKGAEAEAALVQEVLEACEGQETQERVVVNVNPCGASLLNSAEHQQLALVSQAENSAMDVAMLDNHGLDCASQSFDGMCEVFALSDVHGSGSQEGSALPVSQLAPNIESGMSLNGSDPLDLLQTLVRPFQQQISDQQQKIQELGAQILLLQHQQRSLQQQLQESQWPYQFCFQQPQLQDVNQGFPSFEVMEQSMHQHNYPGFMAPPPDEGEVQKDFFELEDYLE